MDMNGYERITAALNGDPADKVPVMLHNFMMAAREYGISMKQFRENPDLMAQSFIASVEKYQLDGIMVDVDTVTLAGALGVPVDFPENEPARTRTGLLAELSDVNKLPEIDIGNYHYVQTWLSAVRKIKEYFGHEVFVRGNCDQLPFSLAGMLRGTENWMTDLYLADETLVRELLNYCTVATSRFIDLMAQTGCDMLSNGDSPAGPDLVPPEIYERFAFPYEKMIVDRAHEKGLPYALHICGNTGLILSQMIQTGADAFELDYKTDIRVIRGTFKENFTLIGNIDPSGVLAMGTPEGIRKTTLELLEIFGRSNRFILNAGCAIPPTTPERNIRAMIDTARDYTKN
jgi:uroporphyrinogen decarboxylase